MSDYIRSVMPPYISQKLLEYYKAHDEDTLVVQIGETKTSLSKADLQEKSMMMAFKVFKQTDTTQLGNRISTRKRALKERDLKTEVKEDTSTPSIREVWDHSVSPTKQVLGSVTKQTSSDPEAKACFQHMTAADNFYRTYFHIYPLPSSKKMKAFVRSPLQEAFNNALWKPSDQCVHFGIFDDKFFNNFVFYQDIMIHEFGHAVVSYSAKFFNREQPGALNESIADIFAVMAQHQQSNVKANAEDAKWLFGEGVFKENKKFALRSLSQPGTAFDSTILGKDPQPAHYEDYQVMTVDEDGDMGGVHMNSGIPSRAFYLAAKELQGPSWKDIGKIWHEAVKISEPDDNFRIFAGKTVQAAKNLKYAKEPHINAIHKAWYDVGVDVLIPRRYVKLPTQEKPKPTSTVKKPSETTEIPS